jgi:hypothetical protein
MHVIHIVSVPVLFRVSYLGICDSVVSVLACSLYYVHVPTFDPGAVASVGEACVVAFATSLITLHEVP